MKVKIAIVVQGGVVCDVYSLNNPVDVEYLIIDNDTQEYEEDEVEDGITPEEFEEAKWEHTPLTN